MQPQLDACLAGGAQPEEGTSSAPTSAFFSAEYGCAKYGNATQDFRGKKLKMTLLEMFDHFFFQ